MARQVIAMGGGGCISEPGNCLLEEYLLRQSDRDNPKVCFIGTASGDHEEFIKLFYDTFTRYQCQPSHLSLFGHPPGDLVAFLCEQDIVYVGPRYARNMMALWNEWDMGSALLDALEHNVILAGVSAGAMCWYSEGLTLRHPPNIISPLAGLGTLPGSICPHYNIDVRREAYHRLILAGKISSGIGVEDDVAVASIFKRTH